METMSIGARIKLARQSLGLARNDLAAEVPITYATLAGIENGDQKTTPKLWRIAEVLKVNVRWLETGSGSPDVGRGDDSMPAQHGSISEPARPDNLSEMERKSIARIEAAAAKIGGKAEAFLEGMAVVLESELGTPSEDVGVLSKKQYALVRAAQFLAGTVPDAQANAMANMIYSFSAAAHGAGVPVISQEEFQRSHSASGKDFAKRLTDPNNQTPLRPTGKPQKARGKRSA